MGTMFWDVLGFCFSLLSIVLSFVCTFVLGDMPKKVTIPSWILFGLSFLMIFVCMHVSGNIHHQETQKVLEQLYQGRTVNYEMIRLDRDTKVDPRTGVLYMVGNQCMTVKHNSDGSVMTIKDYHRR